MNSFDVFDTLVGRWYIDDDDYKSDGDFPKEVLHTYPIIENKKKLTPDSVIVSDTYFSKEQVKEILEKNGMTEYADLMVSYDDKWTGKTWKTFKPSHHLGDNRVSDYEQPTRYGVNATHYTGSQLTEVENFLIQSGYKRLAGLTRAVRLSNPFTDEVERWDLWNEQAQINIPLLVMISNHLATKDSSDYLFTMRDCCNLLPMFELLYPKLKSSAFYTSRNLYNNPTPTFMQYLDDTVSKDSLIVDLQGTAKSCRQILPETRYFTVVYSDLENTFPIEYLVHRKDGYTDKIERVNYDIFKSCNQLEKINGYWCNANEEWLDERYSRLILAQRMANVQARNFIKDGFQLENSFSQEVVTYLLRRLEQECFACKYLNHEEI